MIESRMLEKSFHYNIDLMESNNGLNSVFAAAVVDRSFREMLLQNPEAALGQGYLGKGFTLSQMETSIILSANANSLSELANQVLLALGK